LNLPEQFHNRVGYSWICAGLSESEVTTAMSVEKIVMYGGRTSTKRYPRVMTDATLIAADASLNSLVHNDPEQAQREDEA
jgi:hypothetical protein